jgi:hypothetical protein
MEQKQSSNSQGRPQRPANRRRWRRRRRSPATSPGSAPVANRRPAAHGDAPPGAGEAYERRPPHTASASLAPREAAQGPFAAPLAATAAAAEPASGALACPLCAEPVRDLYTAIAYGQHSAPAHFDCIVALLGEREELEEGAWLCYLGGGSFGIVQMLPAAGRGDRGGSLLIHKRIEVEDKDAAPEWRQGLRLPLGDRFVSVAASEAAPCK